MALTAGLGAWSAPAHAADDAPVQALAVPIDATTYRVMSWNVCGKNKACDLTKNPADMAGKIVWHMTKHGGRKADAAILQEYCQGQSDRLRTKLFEAYGYRWSVWFAHVDKVTAPGKPKFRCPDGGKFGLAIVVPAGKRWYDTWKLPVKSGAEKRMAQCLTVEGARLKICNTHLSYGGDDSTHEFRRKQVTALRDQVVGNSRFRVVFGGDLNHLPPDAKPTSPSPGLNPLYDRWTECDQINSTSRRDGFGTHYEKGPKSNSNMRKLDYLFLTGGIRHDCSTPDGVVASSDHRPFWIDAHLPATTMVARAEAQAERAAFGLSLDEVDVPADDPVVTNPDPDFESSEPETGE